MSAAILGIETGTLISNLLILGCWIFVLTYGPYALYMWIRYYVKPLWHAYKQAAAQRLQEQHEWEQRKNGV